jgi:signal transduction histidine kinase
MTGVVSTTPPRGAAARRVWQDLRPLDPVRSIKAKLGLLVATSVIASTLFTWYALFVLGLPVRYTLPVVVAVCLVITQVLAHGMTSPLRQMTAAVRETAAGRPIPPVRATSRDEVGELARAFTAMAADLLTADQQRKDLMANVGHELRTPVAAVRAQLENLVDGVRDADPEALTELLDQVERLGELVDDLLDLARTEAGVTPLARRRVVVEPLLRDVAGQVDAARPGRVIRVDAAPGLATDADPARLRQVVVNLVDNAARHSPAGGQIDVVARPGTIDGGLILEVTDDGPGIPRDEWDAVFARFRRGAGTGSDGGTGLGLAIARWAVALHGGGIAVVPSPRGCRIRVTLPPAPPGG